MKADTSITTTYFLNDLDWNELWDIYNGLELLLKTLDTKSDRVRIGDMMNEIKRITDTK